MKGPSQAITIRGVSLPLTIEDSQELFWKTDEDAGKASIMGELSVHPDGHRAGREAVQSFRSSARHRNL